MFFTPNQYEAHCLLLAYAICLPFTYLEDSKPVTASVEDLVEWKWVILTEK